LLDWDNDKFTNLTLEQDQFSRARLMHLLSRLLKIAITELMVGGTSLHYFPYIDESLND